MSVSPDDVPNGNGDEDGAFALDGGLHPTGWLRDLDPATAAGTGRYEVIAHDGYTVLQGFGHSRTRDFLDNVRRWCKMGDGRSQHEKPGTGCK